jgi:hypothetical protein
MTIFLRQSTASQEIPIGYCVDSTDGNTEETGLTIANTDIKLWKNGATSLASKNSGGATHISNGIYYAVLDATDTDTLGSMIIYVHVAGMLARELHCAVLTANVYDTLFSTDILQADLTQIGGVAQSATDLKDLADTGYDPSAHKLQGVVLVDTTTTNTDMVDYSTEVAHLDADISSRAPEAGGNVADILADTNELQGLIASSKIAAQVKGIDDIDLSATMKTSVNAEVDTALSDLDLDHLIKTTYGGADPTVGSLMDLMLNKDGSQTFSQATDSLEAIRDNQAGADAAAIADAVWDEAIAGHTTGATFGGKNQKVVPSETIGDYKATGFSTHSAANVWAVGTRALTDKAGFSLSTAGVDAVIDEVVEGTLTVRQAIRLLLSHHTGKSSGGGTNTLVYRDVGDSKDRLTYTVDADGNRSAVVRDGS